MVADAVAAPHDALERLRPPLDPLAEHEEGAPRSLRLQDVHDLVGARRIRSVVEGQRDLGLVTPCVRVVGQRHGAAEKPRWHHAVRSGRKRSNHSSVAIRVHTSPP